MAPRLFLTALLCAGLLAPGTRAAAQPGYRYALALTIDSLGAEELRWANGLRHYAAAGLTDTALRGALLRGQAAAQRGIRATLRRILDTEGYPGVREVGAQTSETFWQLLQHADDDPDLQRLAVEKMRAGVDSRNVPGAQYAFLVDRLLVNGGNLQLYGTQMRLRTDSTTFEPRPVQDPAHLDDRRAILGLPPMAQYVELMNRRYKDQLKGRE